VPIIPAPSIHYIEKHSRGVQFSCTPLSAIFKHHLNTYYKHVRVYGYRSLSIFLYFLHNYHRIRTVSVVLPKKLIIIIWYFVLQQRTEVPFIRIRIYIYLTLHCSRRTTGHKSLARGSRSI